METEALDALLIALAGLGLVKLGGRQRTDSTHVLGRLRSLNRLELAGESIRAALEALAAAALAWLAGVIDEQWAGVYGSRIDNLHLPQSDTKRAALALSYGRDGYRLLEAVYAACAPAWLAELPAVETLRRIWVQQYYRVIDEAGEQVIRRKRPSRGSRRADRGWSPPTTWMPATARNAARAGPATRPTSPRPAPPPARTTRTPADPPHRT